MKMSHNLDEDDIVSSIEEYKNPTSDLEDMLPVHIIPYKVEITRTNEEPSHQNLCTLRKILKHTFQNMIEY